MTTDITIREVQPDDWPAVREIYEAGIATGHATFETSVPTWEQWDRRHLEEHRPLGVRAHTDETPDRQCRSAITGAERWMHASNSDRATLDGCCAKPAIGA